jgi:signal transduction histidine kinase
MKKATEPDRRTPPSASAARSLRRLRLRVTAWYVGTFAVVLVALGAMLYVALAHDVSVNLDSSLRKSTREIANAAQRREQERATPGGGAIDAVEELRIPDRSLYLFDLAGRALSPPSADSALRSLAARAAARGEASGRWEAPEDQSLQGYAERFTTKGGASYVAAVVVDRDPIDDRYAELMTLVGGLGALGLVLVATGGWMLARKSVAPVERSMEQMRRFMADAAHELRTPVSVIRSRVDVALEQPRDIQGYERTLHELRGEIERLASLVNDLFTLARADADERTFAPVRVQLDEIVLEAVTTAGWIAARRGITLHVEDADEVVIDGDPAQLRQLAMILLDNGIKFSDSGGSVRISVRERPEGAALVVEDRGVGIAKADLERVFDRFYRAESVRGSTTGAGLGLAIARWIADAHGARIALEPAPEGGTRVTVAFPPAVA